MLKNMVSFYCEDGSVPGGAWTAEVEFRPLKSGFSVLQRLSSFDEKPFKFRRVGRRKQPLTWRLIVECLRSSEVNGLGGFRLIDSILVTGLPSGWISELCAIAWIEFENECDELLEHLLTLDDDEIAIYYSLIGPFAEEGAPSRLEELNQALYPLSLAPSSLARVQQELGWIPGMDWEELVNNAQSLGLIYSLAADAEVRDSSLVEITASIGLDEQSSLEQRIEKLEALADAAARRAQANRDLNLLAALSENARGNQWSKEFFEACFELRGRFPEEFADTALRDWIDLTEKPVARGVRPDIDPRLEILSWILSSCSEDRVRRFFGEHPGRLKRTLTWLNALREQQTIEFAQCEKMPGGFIGGRIRSENIARIQSLIDSTDRTINFVGGPIHQ
jgi:hypothetical protein